MNGRYRHPPVVSPLVLKLLKKEEKSASRLMGKECTVGGQALPVTQLDGGDIWHGRHERFEIRISQGPAIK
jgi:hypothetical protein